MENHLLIESRQGEKLSTSFYRSTLGKSDKIVIFIHGFKGFKDWGFFPYSAKYFSKFGIDSLTFNFSHNGIGDDFQNFTELDKFAKNTITLELLEIEDVVNYCVNLSRYNKIFLIGHSKGGGEAIISASKISAISGLITWNTVNSFLRYSEKQIKNWKERGFFEFPNSRTKQIFKLYDSYLQDIIENHNLLFDIKNSLIKLNIPVLLIHGEEDLTVKPEESERLFSIANKEKVQICLIKSAGHTFNIEHPMTKTTKALNIALNKSLEFIKNIN